MKRLLFSFLKKKWWMVLVLVVVGGVVYAAVGRKPSPPQMVTVVVERGVLRQSVEATGTLEAIDRVDLAFDTSGTVRSLFAKVGDDVKAGDLLAELEANDLRAAVQSAGRAVQIAQANLAKAEAGSTTEAVEIAQAAVTVAEAGVSAAAVSFENSQQEAEKTKTVADEQVASAQAALESASSALLNVQSKDVQAEKEAWEDFVGILQTAMISDRSDLSEADEVLGIDNVSANDDFEDVLSATDESVLVAAENAYDIAKKSRDAAEPLTFALTTDASSSSINVVVALVETALADTAETLLYTRQALDATAVSTATFSSTELSNLKASVDTARQDIQKKQDALVAQLQTIETLVVTSKTQEDAASRTVAEAEQAVVSAQASQSSSMVTVDAAVRSAEAALVSQQAALVQAQANVAQVEANPRSVDLAPLEAEVGRTQSEFAAAQARLAKAEIRSPIDGKVTDVKVEEGEQVASAAVSPVVIVQATQKAFKIVVDVPESDIAKVSVDDLVEITFDAFGEDTVVKGRVTEIDPAQKTVEGVVFYETTVHLDTTDGLDLKPGLSSNVTIVTAEVADALMIPQRSVLERGKDKYVRVARPADLNIYDERTVKIGLRGDEGRVQVLKGLSEGETIIVSIRD
ncbi:MAG TPA: efflux RND transporter periplasmic adaptor subunit [Patescibacteria group bacterium]|nr:efflux RND transporter periplasmic adaptor subunit [Patescibacteria group bacterium]